MKKIKSIITLSAVMVYVLLVVPQTSFSVSAAEKKPVGIMRCSCGYTMEFYTPNMSDDEYTVWYNHMIDHALKGELHSETILEVPENWNTNNNSNSGTNSTTNNTTSNNSTGNSNNTTQNSSNSNTNQTSNTNTSTSTSNSGTSANTQKDNAKYGKRQLTARSVNYKTISLSWNAVSGAKSYEIYYSTSANGGFKRLATAKGTSYKFSKASCGKTYYFKMRVKTKTATSEFGPVTKAKTTLNGTPSIQVKNSTYNSVTLKWSKVSGAKKYKIYYKNGNSGWQMLTTTGGTSYTHKKLTTGATYSYKVCAMCDSFTTGWSNSTKTTLHLANVSGLKTKVAGTGRVTVSWKKVKGATQYVVLRSTSMNGKYETVSRSGKTSYIDKDVKTGKTYFYKVYAVSGKYRSSETKPVKQTVTVKKK